MLKVLRSNQRGHNNLGWLDTYHTFSFDNYYNPEYMKHGVLRVLNEDTVQPLGGFSKHHHNDMEIISYVVSGTLEHEDSMGNGSDIQTGDIQYMSAGSGVNHSESNPSESIPVKFLQIWLFPNRKNLTPKYNQISVTREDKLNKWLCVASSDGQQNSIQISSDAKIFTTILQPGYTLTQNIASQKAWLQVISGQISILDHILDKGDGAAIEDMAELNVTATHESEILLIEC